MFSTSFRNIRCGTIGRALSELHFLIRRTFTLGKDLGNSTSLGQLLILSHNREG
uniref:Uncharacterized protein n=1 Tax=Rhizophora mucronata TaxID=61149 RepID=A0A2P2QER9_RHIMU